MCRRVESPMAAMKKSNGGIRILRDYRKLNALTIAGKYPIPDMSDHFNELGNANVSTTMDAKSRSWQVNLDEPSRDYTALSCKFGLSR